VSGRSPQFQPVLFQVLPQRTRISLRFLPGCFALRIDTPGASPLPPRLAPPVSFAILPCGLPAALVRSYGISPKFTAGSLLYVPVFGRFLSIPFRIVALRLRPGCSEPIAFAESFFPLSGSLGTQVMF
jgi:hypothetical protein